jgi:hypothetical protein
VSTAAKAGWFWKTVGIVLVVLGGAGLLWMSGFFVVMMLMLRYGGERRVFVVNSMTTDVDLALRCNDQSRAFHLSGGKDETWKLDGFGPSTCEVIGLAQPHTCHGDQSQLYVQVSADGGLDCFGD